jgi:histone demethylase
VWQCESRKSQSTLGKYGAYQTTTFQDNVKEELDKSSAYKADSEEFRNEELRRQKKLQGCLQFGSSVDLSDMRYWRPQMTELMKLPSWARVVSAGNMLSHVGYPISGCNTVSLQMSVPQSRVTAHQDSNGFCSIHINIGPGDCEWFAVRFDYWGALLALCEQNGVDFCQASWWPNMKDLMEDEIPVYRFLQRPGDMVWVNSGSIYWVQAIGWCNSIKWNVGPLTSDQYQMAVEKYEWNKLHFAKSAVPMYHLSWNLARNLRIMDEKLFAKVKSFALGTLQNYLIVKEYLKHNKIEPKFQAKKKNAPVQFCSQCGEEIFALMFVEEVKGEPLLCCYICAKMKNSALTDFICIEEFSKKELLFVFDNFLLHHQQQPGPSNGSAIFGHSVLNNSLLSYC